MHARRKMMSGRTRDEAAAESGDDDEAVYEDTPTKVATADESPADDDEDDDEGDEDEGDEDDKPAAGESRKFKGKEEEVDEHRIPVVGSFDDSALPLITSVKGKLSKRAAALVPYQPAHRRLTANKMMAKICHDMQVEYGDPDIGPGGTALVMGVPVPSFSAEYLFQNNFFPLERVIQLVGKEGTCKSGLGAEIMRWFISIGGGLGYVLENESKFSQDWFPSILGWENKNAFGLIPCDSVDDWQERYLFLLQRTKDEMQGDKTKPGPGLIYPMFAMVDSVMGKSMAESQRTIDANGHAGRSHPIEALSITAFMRHVPQKLRGWPFSLLLINHLKLSQKPGSYVEKRNLAGGTGKEFQETLELEMRKTGKLKARTYEGLNLELRCEKNAMGVTSRRIPLRVLWWAEPDEPGNKRSRHRQKTVWDWHGSTIDLLKKMEGAEASRRKEVIDLRDIKVGKSKRIWSKALKISKSDAVLPYDAGRLLMETPGVLQDLRNVFGVKVGAVFTFGKDYLKQRAAEKQKCIAEDEAAEKILIAAALKKRKAKTDG